MELIQDLNHLDEHSRAVALLPAEERIAWIKHERWIEYSRGLRAVDRISNLLVHPPRDRMPCLLLHGTTGMRRTRMLQKFLRSHTAAFDEQPASPIRPLLRSKCRPTPMKLICMKKPSSASAPAFHTLLFDGNAPQSSQSCVPANECPHARHR